MGCYSSSTLQADFIQSLVSEDNVKAERNANLQIGMPVTQASEYLEKLGFRLYPCSVSGLNVVQEGESTMQFVRILPHPTPIHQAHNEVHVLLFHDGERLTELKSKTISTTVDPCFIGPEIWRSELTTRKP
jgi:hypothetical protein